MSGSQETEEDDGSWWEWAQSTKNNSDYISSPGLRAMAEAARQAVPAESVNSPLVKSARGFRDARDPTPHKSGDAPGRADEAGTSGTKSARRAHFDLLEESETRKAGVYWVGVDREGQLEPPRWICSPMRVGNEG